MKKILLVVYTTLYGAVESNFIVLDESELIGIGEFVKELKKHNNEFQYKTINKLYPEYYSTNEFLEVRSKQYIGRILLLLLPKHIGRINKLAIYHLENEQELI